MLRKGLDSAAVSHSTMSLQNHKNEKLDDTDLHTVYGYVRQNFDKKCWIDQVIQQIVKYYQRIGLNLYVFGNGYFGRLGIEKYKNKICDVPTLCIPFNVNNALKVKAGFCHTIVLDVDNCVWCFGAGSQWQLGHGQATDLFVPTKLDLNVRIISLSAGDAHSLLLCDNGFVHGFGNNDQGQLGLGDDFYSPSPKTIEELKPYKITQISANGQYSAALTVDGVLFCFGWNYQGQCGVGMGKGRKIKTPTKVKMNDKIAFVDCGIHHTLLITRKHAIYSFGDGHDHQTGHTGIQWVPKLIVSLQQNKMKTCAAGEKHSLCVDYDGIIWSFGDNGCGQCGFLCNINQVIFPTKIQWFITNNVKAKECCAGINASSVIAEDGSLYVFGSNGYNKLGLKEIKNYHSPTKLPLPQKTSIKSMSIGGEHSAFLL